MREIMKGSCEPASYSLYCLGCLSLFCSFMMEHVHSFLWANESAKLFVIVSIKKTGSTNYISVNLFLIFLVFKLVAVHVKDELSFSRL